MCPGELRQLQCDLSSECLCVQWRVWMRIRAYHLCHENLHAYEITGVMENPANKTVKRAILHPELGVPGLPRKTVSRYKGAP